MEPSLVWSNGASTGGYGIDFKHTSNFSVIAISESRNKLDNIFKVTDLNLILTGYELYIIASKTPSKILYFCIIIGII